MKCRFCVRDPGSAATHFLGFLIVIPVFVVLLREAFLQASIAHLIGFSIFGLSLLLLYGASTVYHTLVVSEEKQFLLRQIDHIMIFVLIAGTYTPICLISLQGVWGSVLLVLIWILAAMGILWKMVWMQAPRWLSTALYVFMGWLAVIALVPLKQAVDWNGIRVLLYGGVMYTVGAVIYALKKPNPNWKHFGFHEIFHVFVLLGSGFHIAFMFFYVL
ncbi:MAG TPA: hemolysin III family protein [Candidatus Anaerotignum merdipullorum]|nr:hemolysin III family protein [Candidatus Anaerotignum merdipullorum]